MGKKQYAPLRSITLREFKTMVAGIDPAWDDKIVYAFGPNKHGGPLQMILCGEFIQLIGYPLLIKPCSVTKKKP